MRNKIFEKIPITIPNRSGFDLSHENRGTAKVGILVPVMTREMEGHDSLSVNLGAQIQFAPFATDFYGRIKCYFEAFFVPYRIIDGSYKDLYSYSLSSMQGSGSSPSVADGAFNNYFEGLRVYDLSPTGTTPSEDSDNPHPMLDATMTADPSVGLVGPCTLLDYLGVKCGKIQTGSGAAKYLRLNNYHRLSAYHRIYEEYYMDARIQKHAFARYRSGSLNNNQMLLSSPYRGTPYNSGNKVFWTDGPLLDGVYMTGLRSRNYAKDYFTTATPDPQFGGEIGFEVDSNGRATISQVRVANALQQFVELHNKCGVHYDDLAFARTGIRPSDAAVDIPVYLGRQIYDVYNKSVYQQNGGEMDGNDSVSGYPSLLSNSPNPFGSTGSKFANGQALGSGHICDFTATEGGIFMILMSVVPEASYGTGSARQWDYDNIFDLPTPQLEGIGDQPIYLGELLNSEVKLIGGSLQFVTHDRDRVFGYTQRFAEAKFMLDETHGLLRDGMSLSAFALKRSFFTDPALGKEFLTVPINALNEVSAIINDDHQLGLNPMSAFGYWFDCYFDVKLVSNLSAYSIPTLENMKGHTEMVDNGGRRF